MRNVRDFDTDRVRAIVVTRPLGDPGGIQEYCRGLLRSSSIEAIHVGRMGPAGHRRLVRALRRAASTAHAYGAAMRHHGCPIIVGHVGLVELLPLMSSVRTGVVVIYGREVETLHPLARRLWEWTAARGRVQFAAISDSTAELAGQFGWNVNGWARLTPALWSDRSITPPTPRGDGPLEVVTVARLSSDSRRKNVDLLIRAVGQVRSSEHDVRLTVIGDGDLRDELTSLASRVAAGAVTFTGRVDDATRSRLLQQSHVFALPSEQEGFGLVVLEAWEAGLAVVGCNRRALGEVISNGRTGLTPEPDASAIAQALINLTDERVRTHLAQEGQRTLAEQYSPDAFAEELRRLVLPPSTGAHRTS